jgi:wyosine [tRNA(Phe)-imidazoG37] synthetase (radical SAM superfamily)
MSIIFEQSVFGPIKSRRFGFSLGINLLPSDGKICNFDCVYCECGSNEKSSTKSSFPTKEEVIHAFHEEMIQSIASLDRLEVITFAGNGEPTLHPDFDWIVKEIKELKNQFVPDAQLVLLSNGTTWKQEHTFQALKNFDVLQCKLDPFCELVNRSKGSWKQEDLIELLKDFPLEYQIQSMLLKSTLNPNMDGSNLDLLNEWIHSLTQLKPEQVVIYTVDRSAAENDIEALSYAELVAVKNEIEKNGLSCQLVY